MTDAELANLLTDCLAVWGIPGRVVPGESGLCVSAGGLSCTVGRAAPEQRPARWLLQTAERAAAGRPPAACTSITGLLGGVRDALGADTPGPGLDVVEPEWSRSP
ncbi:MAG: hypothetical protein M0002_00735 [Rhodospirillales bacterium]|nr:hypothetical protein [Rhodospirillales bacterium]